MMASSLYWVYGMLGQRTYLLTLMQSHEPGLLTYLHRILPLPILVYALGAFALLTGLAHWPEVLKRKKSVERVSNQPASNAN